SLIGSEPTRQSDKNHNRVIPAVRFSHATRSGCQVGSIDSGAVEVAEHLAALVREGDLLAAAADRTPLDTPVPTCPQWTMRDLVRHVGDVHRWAAAHVAEGRIRPIGKHELPSVAGPLPEVAHLVEGVPRAHRRLV